MSVVSMKPCDKKSGLCYRVNQATGLFYARILLFQLADLGGLAGSNQFLKKTRLAILRDKKQFSPVASPHREFAPVFETRFLSAPSLPFEENDWT